jgi:hypothetical protein
VHLHHKKAGELQAIASREASPLPAAPVDKQVTSMASLNWYF